MAIVYTKKDQGKTLTTGGGIPSHSAIAGDEYTDTTSGIHYIYTTSWVALSTGTGVSIDPYYNVGTASTVTWDVSGTSTNYRVTLTGTTTINLTNVRDGDYGTIIVKQDNVGSRTVSFGTVNGSSSTHKVVNGGSGSPVLTSNSNAIDILSFTYDKTDSIMYWTVGNDYT
jgi:hypothetical protein